ncbi:hypothetical protein Oscil6304_4567 [Oscillatoria acuminata PCC 6304]|uniref:Uncharacterized protein n=1 Tax=Oscillatoria acuminata PCC 6304 TaxID=56110 RepID=K9TPI5_9CYAN|nr:hypothetical protein Oscil6304_4567 [Oscillatoria acuminata PCC 6304]
MGRASPGFFSKTVIKLAGGPLPGVVGRSKVVTPDESGKIDALSFTAVFVKTLEGED